MTLELTSNPANNSFESNENYSLHERFHNLRYEIKFQIHYSRKSLKLLPVPLNDFENFTWTIFEQLKSTKQGSFPKTNLMLRGFRLTVGDYYWTELK